MGRKEDNKKYYEANKKRISEQHREYREKNKEKILERQRKYDKINKDNKRNKELRKKYGISLKAYNILYELQGGKCSICDRHQKELKRDLDLDHDHNTGKVRELLCMKCNTGLGLFNHNISLLERSIIYLKKHRVGRS